jgi:hypothetical protein
MHCDIRAPLGVARVYQSLPNWPQRKAIDQDDNRWEYSRRKKRQQKRITAGDVADSN